MSEDRIAEDGTIISSGDRKKEETEEEKLQKEFDLLEYEVLNNHGHPTKDPVKLARYEELKKILKIDEVAKGNAFFKAKQKILGNISSKSADDKSKLLAVWKNRQNG